MTQPPWFFISTYSHSLFSVSFSHSLVRTFPGGCTLTPLPGIISVDVLIMLLKSNPFKISPPLSSLPLLFCYLCYSCIAPLLSYLTSSLPLMVSSFLPPLHLCPAFLCFSSTICTSRHQHGSFPVKDFHKYLLKLVGYIIF